MMAWGGVLNLEYAVRGFWSDKMREWHIAHLELEAVFKTVQAFLRELEGKVVRLYCDNQAVLAILSHFTSRNPDLMRRMRRLWSLLDLHDIELQARCIRSEANVWADNLPRLVSPYWPDQSWFRELEALEATEVTVGTRLEVFWEDDDKFYPGAVKSFNDDGTALMAYDDGDEETLNLSEEKFNILLSKGEDEQNKECGGDYKENKRSGDTHSHRVSLSVHSVDDGRTSWAEEAVHEEDIVTQRTWLPAIHTFHVSLLGRGENLDVAAVKWGRGRRGGGRGEPRAGGEDGDVIGMVGTMDLEAGERVMGVEEKVVMVVVESMFLVRYTCQVEG
ncbi:hypothetical protein CYMTET_24932 [Cymbomonas tetramitiformis]|uniref:Reverse transcriptase RNase H-like domain-containing protein n=1 Tax=Cymbomonas tetramitiformis TaxID=36881 RepID=A0AAE0FVF7_9CHLO|nr:hypothetical protein CYMTET_24932 [Cymbomonas tetramitiformis]